MSRIQRLADENQQALNIVSNAAQTQANVLQASRPLPVPAARMVSGNIYANGQVIGSGLDRDGRLL